MARGDGPYKIMRKARENACKIKLSGYMNIFSTFNIGLSCSLH